MTGMMTERLMRSGDHTELMVRLETITCANCGILFAVPVTWLWDRRNDGADFSCPNGHGQVFRTTEADRLRAQLAERDAEIARRQREVDGALDRLNTEKRSHAATRGQMTRLRNRAEKGVCLYCHRTFANVARHMHGQHQQDIAGAAQ